MNIEAIAAKAGASISGATHAPALPAGTLSIESGDGAQFRAALERHMNTLSAAAPNQGASGKESVGDKIMTRAGDLASDLKQDQQYVSKMLEQATRSADSIQLMKAMMALNDYQMRVQFVSKTASKATTALDSLTKLQ